MKLFVFATLAEAKSSIDKLKCETTSDPNCFLFEKGKLIISGWGCYYAMMAISKYGNEASEIINLGIAASLKKHPIGHITTIKSVSKYCQDPSSKALPILQLTEGEHLVTTDFAVHSKEFQKELSSYDLLDMEGYGIVFAAHYLNKKVTLVKAVSDYAVEGGRKLINDNKDKLSNILADYALNNFHKP